MYVFEIIFMYVCTINDVEPGFQAKDFHDTRHTHKTVEGGSIRVDPNQKNSTILEERTG